MKKQLYFFGLLFFPCFMQAQNVGIGTTTPVTKLNIVGSGSSPAIPDATSTALFRIGVTAIEGVDFGKMSLPPYSAWMQAGVSGIITDPLSLQPLGGNVGIGTISPNEKLDITGNINVTGTIKANGVDGTANQVLMKNSSGIFSWGDITEFKNYITFTTVGSSSWTVPAGVTRIWVEAWGGGGGSTVNGSGGGGGYVTAIFSVIPAGSVSYTVGAAGLAGAPSATSGGSSSVTVAPYFVFGNGGAGDNSIATLNVATGGSFTGSAGFGFYGSAGETGEQNKFEGYQFNATTYREIQTGGKGGNAGNTINTGGKGGYRLKDPVAGTTIYVVYGSDGSVPGGGGGSPGLAGFIKNGGQGMVIIHY